MARGQSVVLYAVVADVAPGAGTPSGDVTFRDGGKAIGSGYLGTVNGTTYTYFITASLAPGTHTITAVYQGDPCDLTSTSAAFTVTVSGGDSPALALAAGPSAAGPGPAAARPTASAAPTASVGTTAPSVISTGLDDPRRVWLAALEALVEEGDDSR